MEKNGLQPTEERRIFVRMFKSREMSHLECKKLDTHFFFLSESVYRINHLGIWTTDISIYRVSIKSFTDYKHLLQENYVQYKHIFFFTIT